MKNNNYIKRGGAFALAGIPLAVALFAVTASAQRLYVAPQGLYIDGSTNVIMQQGSNSPVALVLPAENRFFNLIGVNGTQANTNLWPKLGFTSGREQGMAGLYLGLQVTFNTAASKASNLVFNVAGSVDGTHWLTNPCPVVLSVAQNNANMATGWTNINTGAYPFWTLYSIDARNCDATSSNLWIGAVSKNQ